MKDFGRKVGVCAMIFGSGLWATGCSDVVNTKLSGTMDVPRSLHPAYPDDAGIVDVTQSPFYAKGDGITDDTEAILRALRDDPDFDDEHHFRTRTIYFPPGTYLVSDTLLPSRPDNPEQSKPFIRFLGAGRDETVLLLADEAAGFQDPANPRAVIQTGNSHREPLPGLPNAGFGNYVQHLTVDTGASNPGAMGIRFDVANVGALEHVEVRSLDRANPSYAGLAFRSVCGAGYVRDLTVDGFAYGVHFDNSSVNNIVMEWLDLRNQTVAGIFNGGKSLQLRQIRSSNSVPVLVSAMPWAATWLLDAELTAPEGSPDAAIVLQRGGFLFLRNVTAKGYQRILKAEENSIDLPDGLEVSEWLSMPPYGEGMVSLNLAVEEPPEYHSPDFEDWANVLDYGAKRNDPDHDSGPAIQAAIDSGKPVIYFPHGRYFSAIPIEVRGAVRKLDGIFSSLESMEAGSAVALYFEESDHPVIFQNFTLDGIPMIHASTGILSLRNIGGPSRITCAEGAGGKLFVTNVGPHTRLSVGPGVRAWARQLNREREPFDNQGGEFWLFGDNIERMSRGHWGQPAISTSETSGRGKTEIIGGAMDAIHAHHDGSGGPLFLIQPEARFSATYAGEDRVNRQTGIMGQWGVHLEHRKTDNEKTLLTQENMVSIPVGSSERIRRTVLPLYSTGKNPNF